MFQLHNKSKHKISLWIIPIIVLGIFLAPISPVLENRAGNLVAGVEVNTINAQNTDETTVDISIDPKDVGTDSVTVHITVNNTNTNYNDALVAIGLYSQEFDITSIPWPTSTKIDEKGFTKDETPSQTFEKTFNGLTPGKNYFVVGMITKIKSLAPGWHTAIDGLSVLFGGDLSLSDAVNGLVANHTNFTTSTDENSTGTVGQQNTSTEVLKPGLVFSCGIIGNGTVKGCLAELSYTIFEISAWIGEGMGRFLDFFVYYSTNSTSYTNEFVSKAFGAVRDIANIFFIIALLFIAIKTILGLSTANNKKIIGTIVVVALLINFSLFATQIIIDATNILAKVFYNQISNKDEKGNVLPAGAAGQKSISIGLMNKFNPQKILTAGTKSSTSAQVYYDGNKGKFIFITLLAVFITLYTAFIFLMVALLFVGRVVALWISMIFAPIAFASLTIPGLKIPGIGFKDWWDELAKNAFLAPAFIFFLYIIVMFAGFMNTIITYPESPDTIQNLMSVVVPFAILTILLMKAKEMAVKLSGEIGKAITGMVKTVGGVVGGAALGAAAFAGVGVVGTLASKIKGSEGLQKAALEGKGLTGWGARLAMKTADKGSKATFDVRNTAVGGALGKGMGMDFQSAKMIGLGKKEGGFQGRTEREAKKIEVESNIYKTKMTDAEVAAKGLKDKNGIDIKTAADYNRSKQDQFRENIGKNDLLSSLGYTIATRGGKINNETINKDAIKANDERDYEKEKEEFLSKKDKEYKSKNYKPTIADNIKDEEEFKKNNPNKEEFIKKFTEDRIAELDKQAQNVKMIIGGGLAVGLGAATGGAMFGPLAGGLIGGALGGGAALADQAKNQEAERLARLAIEKSTKQMGTLSSRIGELTNTLASQEKILKDAKEKPQFKDIFSSDGTIKKDELAKQTEKEKINLDLFRKTMTDYQKLIKKQQADGNTKGAEETEKKMKNEEIGWSKSIENMRILKELENIEDSINANKQRLFVAKGGNPNTGAIPNAPVVPGK